MSSSNAREMAKLVRTLVDEFGIEARTTAAGHWRLSYGGKTITAASSPSDRHAIRLVKSDCRRYLGIDVSGK